MDGWMDERMNICNYVCTNVNVYLCVDVCVYTCVVAYTTWCPFLWVHVFLFLPHCVSACVRVCVHARVENAATRSFTAVRGPICKHFKPENCGTVTAAKPPSSPAAESRWTVLRAAAISSVAKHSTAENTFARGCAA